MTSFHGPNTDNLRKQAKALLRAWQRGDLEARDRVAAFFPNAPRPGLQAVQLVLAREYGFRSWSALTRFVPRLGHFDDIATFRVAREFDVTPERLWDPRRSARGCSRSASSHERVPPMRSARSRP